MRASMLPTKGSGSGSTAFGCLKSVRMAIDSSVSVTPGKTPPGIVSSSSSTNRVALAAALAKGELSDNLKANMASAPLARKHKSTAINLKRSPT
jgi:hypothetical protein